MTAKHKKRTSGRSGGPRTAAGKAVASRNALRHGLAAVTHRQVVPMAAIDRFARTLCGDDHDPELYAAAVSIAENEMTLQAVGAQQVAAVERLRGSYDAPFSKTG